MKELMAAHLNDEVFVDLAAAEKAGHLRAVGLRIIASAFHHFL